MFYSPQRPANIIYAVAAMAIAFAVSFILSFMTLKTESETENNLR